MIGKAMPMKPQALKAQLLEALENPICRQARLHPTPQDSISVTISSLSVSLSLSLSLSLFHSSLSVLYAYMERFIQKSSNVRRNDENTVRLG